MKKDPFHIRIVKAIKDPDFIAEASKEKTNSVIAFMIILLLILTIPTGIIRGIAVKSEINSLLEAVDSSSFPDFQLIDGKFSIDSDEPIIIEQGKQLKLIVDVTNQNNINNLVGYSTGYLLTDEVLTITMKGQSPVYYNLSMFNGFEFNKTMFIDQLNLISKISILAVFIGYVIYSIFSTFIRSFLLLLLAFILNRMLQLENMKGSGLYKTVVYSMTIGIILYEIFTVIPLFVQLPIAPDILVTFAPVVLFYIPSSTIMSRGLRLLKVKQQMNKLKPKE